MTLKVNQIYKLKEDIAKDDFLVGDAHKGPYSNDFTLKENFSFKIIDIKNDTIDVEIDDANEEFNGEKYSFDTKEFIRMTRLIEDI